MSYRSVIARLEVCVECGHARAMHTRDSLLRDRCMALIDAVRCPCDNFKAAHKYGAKRTVVDGIRFDSKREARRWQELRLLESTGKIADLERQPAYYFAVSRDRDGARVEVPKRFQYRADFLYRDLETGRVVVEDAKGARTPMYRLKKTLIEAQHEIEIVEV